MKRRIDVDSVDRRRSPLTVPTAALALGLSVVSLAGCAPKDNGQNESPVPPERVIEYVDDPVEDVKFPVNRADFASDQEYAQSGARGKAFADMLHELHTGILEARDNARTVPFESEEMVSEAFKDTQNGRQTLTFYNETRTRELEISSPISENPETMYLGDPLPQGIYFLVYKTGAYDISVNIKVVEGNITVTSIVVVSSDGVEKSVGWNGPYDFAEQTDNIAYGSLIHLSKQVENSNGGEPNTKPTDIPDPLQGLG